MNFHQRFQDQDIRLRYSEIEGAVQRHSYGVRFAYMFFASTVLSVILGAMCLIMTWIGLNQQLIGLILGVTLMKLIRVLPWEPSE